MSEPILQKEDVEILAETSIDEVENEAVDTTANEAAPENQTPTDPKELLEFLKQHEQHGSFPVEMTPKALKWLRNYLQSTAKFKGAQEAIYLATALFYFQAAVEKDKDVKLKEQSAPKVYQFPSQVIQIVNFFLNKFEGSGYGVAEVYLSAAIPVSEGVQKITNVRNQIAALEKELNPEVKEGEEVPAEGTN
jgi:hypothetical protein